jgi:hypothetical protein
MVAAAGLLIFVIGALLPYRKLLVFTAYESDSFAAHPALAMRSETC